MTETSRTTSSDPNPNCYSTVHDWGSDEPVVVTLAEALAACANRPADEIPPLYDAVDPDALEAAVRPRSDRSTDTRVTFTVPELGYSMTVGADGRVEITDRR